jgi:hypothetical protein
MGSYSKFIGSLVGAVFGYAVAKLGLPESFATPDIQMGVVTIFGSLFTYLFPANSTAA